MKCEKCGGLEIKVRETIYRKAEKKANAKKRIAELEKLIKFWKQDL